MVDLSVTLNQGQGHSNGIYENACLRKKKENDLTDEFEIWYTHSLGLFWSPIVFGADPKQIGGWGGGKFW